MPNSWIKSEALEKNAGIASLFIVMFLWGLHLAYPMHRLQHARWIIGGHVVPFYYLFTATLAMGSALLMLTSKRHWSKWELLWFALPVICLPGILHSNDPLWSLRQCLSWILRGVLPGGMIFLTVHLKRRDGLLFYWIYPIIIAAALLGLAELYTGHNPLWNGFDKRIPKTSQPTNPIYRPYETITLSSGPRGTQGNRIPYASTLIGFLPLGLWLLKYEKNSHLAHLLSVGVLSTILILAQVRSVWVGILVTILLMHITGFQKNIRETLKTIAWMLLCLGVFFAWPKTHDLLWSRFNSFSLAEESIRDRLQVLQTMEVLKDHWALGVGFGQFPTACKSYYPGVAVWNATPDNQYLRWAIENGVLSFIFLIAFFIGIARAGCRKIRMMKSPQEADFYRSLLVGWLSVSVTFLFFDGFYWGACNMTFWSLLGLFATSLKTSPANA